jgi:hypothetical protein
MPEEHTESTFTWYEPPTRPGLPGTCTPDGDQLCSSVMASLGTPLRSMAAPSEPTAAELAGDLHGRHGGAIRAPTARLFFVPGSHELTNRWPDLERIAGVMNDVFSLLCQDALARKRHEPGFEHAQVMLHVRNEGVQLVYGIHKSGHDGGIDIKSRAYKMKDTLERVTNRLKETIADSIEVSRKAPIRK